MATRAIDQINIADQDTHIARSIGVGSLTNRHFELIIFPTEQCNFRCTYCYEDFAIGNMRQPVIDGILNLLSARAGTLDKLHLSYFGGEPLLNMKAIRQISGSSRRCGPWRSPWATSPRPPPNSFGISA